MDDAPEILKRVMEEVITAAQSGQSMPEYTPFTEEWYWGKLLEKKPFRSIYAARAGGKQPLIDGLDKNLSQTPREQCELDCLVTNGLHMSGPGQEVVLHGLTGAPELNGRHGRVLPLHGRGAPSAPPAAGRVPVRLAGSREVSCRPQNLAPVGKTPSSPPVSPRPQSEVEPEAEPTGPLADLIRADVLNGMTPPQLLRKHVLEAGLSADKAKCCRCGRPKEKFIALKRTIPLSPTPVRDAVKLECIGCLIRAAEAAGVKPTAKAVERFVDGRIMGSIEACGMILGHPKEFWGGIHGSGQLY